MAWDETIWLNSNIKNALNGNKDTQYKSSYLITESGTWTVPSTGYYKVFCVGAGGNMNAEYGSGQSWPMLQDKYYQSSTASKLNIYIGSAGGVAVKTLELNKDTSYTITIEDSPASYIKSSTNKTSFGDIMYATTGGIGEYYNTTTNRLANGGIGSGGDYNFSGEAARAEQILTTDGLYSFVGASVGCYIPELMRDHVASGFAFLAEDNSAHGAPQATSGLGILGYGSSQGYATYRYFYKPSGASNAYSYILGPVATPQKGGCVLIIPL